VILDQQQLRNKAVAVGVPKLQASIEGFDT
jgi:hypothetical protein